MGTTREVRAGCAGAASRTLLSVALSGFHHSPRRGSVRSRLVLALLSALWFIAPIVSAQTTNTNTAGARTNIIAIAPAEIAAQAESAQATVQSIEADLAADLFTQAVRDNVSVLGRDIKARLEEDSRLLVATPSLLSLRRLASDWEKMREQLSGWKRSLGRRVQELDSQISHLGVLKATWEATRTSSENTNVPPELQRRIRSVLDGIGTTSQKAERQQALILTLQGRVAEEDSRVTQALTAIAHGRRQAFSRLFVQENPPIWEPAVWSHSPQKMADDSRRSLATQ